MKYPMGLFHQILAARKPLVTPKHYERCTEQGFLSFVVYSRRYLSANESNVERKNKNAFSTVYN